MWKSRRFALLMLILSIFCFAAGVYSLFASRFESGDVYPPYSSLRSDPMGTKALYSALERIPGVAVRRNYSDWKKLHGAETEVVLLLGLVPGALTRTLKEESAALEQAAENGARLVLSFQPVKRRAVVKSGPPEPKKDGEEPAKQDDPESVDKTKDKPTGKSEKDDQYAPLDKKWQISPSTLTRQDNSEEEWGRAVLKSSGEGLPASIPHRSLSCFEIRGPSWRVVYEAQGKPVIVERSLGKGSVVLVAESYLFSNEAMRDQRHAALLSWVIGPNSVVVFDEYHHGVVESPGLMTFARKYRLHGFFGSLCLIGLLLVWQRNAPFAPAPAAATEDDEEPAGKDHLSGLIQLLRRNIPPDEVLKICCDEWRRSAGVETAELREKMARVEEVLASENAKSAKNRDVAGAYRTIAAILSRRGHAHE